MSPTAQSRDVLEGSKARAIAALDVYQQEVDPCSHGHVDHGPDDHLGRRLVHSQAGAFGADWDYDEVVAFIEAAEIVTRAKGFLAATGHGVVVYSEKRWVAFATKRVGAVEEGAEPQ